MDQTRLFYVVDSIEDNEEIFETFEAAKAHYDKLSPIRTLDYIGEPNNRRIYIGETTNAYRENDGWNYDDVGFDTFTNIMTVLTEVIL